MPRDIFIRLADQSAVGLFSVQKLPGNVFDEFLLYMPIECAGKFSETCEIVVSFFAQNRVLVAMARQYFNQACSCVDQAYKLLSNQNRHHRYLYVFSLPELSSGRAFLAV